MFICGTRTFNTEREANSNVLEKENDYLKAMKANKTYWATKEEGEEVWEMVKEWCRSDRSL